MITANIIHRVFRIATNDKAGTAFAIDVDGRQYLVTARHVVNTLADECQINLFQHGEWAPLDVTVIGHAEGEIDVSVLAPSRRLTPANPLPLPANSGGLIYGQDVHFLGFPYDILTGYIFAEDGFPLPLVKRATVSALGRNVFLLDGHNNPGFSGGPVVFSLPNHRGLRVAGIVSSFGAVEESILQDGEKTNLTYSYNTGIIVAHDVRSAIALIRANPMGLGL